jgi:serine phosphatase RsbU (regulator of sigma subunit)/anti-sigma regulatory factor (Ser/Thr protein kinase)
MNAFAQTFLRVVRRRPGRAAAADAQIPESLRPAEPPPVEIAPTDPLIPYFQSAAGAVDIEGLELESPALAALKEAGVKMVVPLVSQGELIGLLNLGPRLSEQEYSGDDRRLLDNLATHAAPALRVGQLVREQEAEARTRERLEQELQVARLIQRNFLPKELPDLPGWHVAAFYRPARAVGGDFYDFVELEGDRIGVVVGDVTDKGVPAALVMAATRSLLRASAQRLVSPGAVLERVNEALCPDMPEKMFVTCLYGVLEPSTGLFSYANAGHNVPYVRSDAGVGELRATGMPLGLFPGMAYEEKEAVLRPGDGVLLHSDGLAEAHNPRREMFGFGRLQELVGQRPGGEELIDLLLGELETFTGTGWEQEDDITLVTLQRSGAAASSAGNGAVRTLAEFDVPSEPGNEREAIARVAEAVSGLALPPKRLERLKTAVGEATMNAMEHGNEYRADIPVSIRVLASNERLTVEITDRGGNREIPTPDTPNLEAKLAGEQTPRGWGLFLIENMVDELTTWSDGDRHTVELVVHLEGGADGSDALRRASA